jgi:hypothetical protein
VYWSLHFAESKQSICPSKKQLQQKESENDGALGKTMGKRSKFEQGTAAACDTFAASGNLNI